MWFGDNMKKITVHFTMKSTDSNVSFQTNGEYKSSRLIFNDNEGNKNYIIMKENQIEYYKKGDMDMKFVFDPTKETKGLYQVMGRPFQFRIITKTLTQTQRLIYIQYDLYQNQDLINSHELEITYLEQ